MTHRWLPITFCCLIYITFRQLLTNDVQPSSSVEKGKLLAEPDQFTVSLQAPLGERTQTIKTILTNAGKEKLQINEIATSCGCTSVTPISGKSLNPFESVPLQIQVSLPAYGERATTIFVVTNASQNNRVPISILMKGQEIEVPYTTSWPELMEFTSHDASISLNQIIELRTMEKQNSVPWIHALRQSSTNSVAKLANVSTEPGLTADSVARCYQFELSLAVPQDVDVPLTESFVAELTHPGQKAVPPLRVRTLLVPNVLATPREIFVRLTADKVTEARNLLLAGQPRAMKGLKILPTDVDWLHIGEIQPIVDEQDDTKVLLKCVVKIDFPSSTVRLGTYQSTIVVQTNPETNSLIRIPVLVKRE